MFYPLAGGRSAAHQGEVVAIDGKRLRRSY